MPYPSTCIRNIKCVVVGDAQVGKTCALVAFTANVFPLAPSATVFDNYTTMMMVDDVIVKLVLWDTAGQEEYEKLRPLTYMQCDVVMMMFSVVNVNSFRSIKEHWYPEVKRYCPDTPLFLVGTKTDLKDTASSEQIVPTKAAIDLATELQLTGYCECSALEQRGTREMFERAVRSVFEYEKELARHLEKDDPQNKCLRCIIS
jgi:small GTP-binding protein